MKFDIKMTNMVKCIAIIFMLMHHLFDCFEAVCTYYGVYSLWIPYEYVLLMSKVGKVCVATYVFLTAYGMTESFNNNAVSMNRKEIEIFSFNRYVKLEMNFLFVYIISIITSFLREQTIFEVYGIDKDIRGFLYMVFDMLGLSSYFGTPSLNETWWYMSLAILLVFIMPLLIMLYKKIGKNLLIIGAFVTYLGMTKSMLLCGYALCTILGILFAEEHIFEKIYDISLVKRKKINSLIKFLVCIVLFGVFSLIRGMLVDYWYWTEMIAPILLCVGVMECYTIIPIIEKPIGFIGKHSMNIFLIHTLIFEYYFMDFIYGFKHWGVVLLALLSTSLIGSIIIELIKKICHYDKLVCLVTIKK